ncbi:MspA protein [Mycolicibacterium mucogenicum]|uniref:MspA protein n=1 Tax=Mycolicibacterium mucogenicum TaxID=56689 RepID=A0A1A3GG28_MYCMU|nr:MspA family porin [Mycolicibacterium mucogenicum]OBJ34997.1 MspA protein [Mycolicibacterium mucogenicum]
MLNRYAVLALAVCVLLASGIGPCAAADPNEPVPPAVSPAPPQLVDGAVPSAPPGRLETVDGWHLSVAGSNEFQLPVAPLTTAITSREYLVAGTFTGSVTGNGTTELSGGTLEVGEQIGCGIVADEGEINPGASFTPSIRIPFTPALSGIGDGTGVSLQGKVYLKPGTVTSVAIDKKTFKGTSTRISVTGVRIKTDYCAGPSFIRSYATLTSSTDNTDDVITYLGVTKAV